LLQIDEIVIRDVLSPPDTTRDHTQGGNLRLRTSLLAYINIIPAKYSTNTAIPTVRLLRSREGYLEGKMAIIVERQNFNDDEFLYDDRNSFWWTRVCPICIC
tara:strand:+ start:341 stop:646 length:306 start_codon:yes stop_codon:yes gene_type:complete